MTTGNGYSKSRLGFDNYREWCDETSDSFRRVGILDEAFYDAALEDPRTILTGTSNGMIPLLTPIEYEPFYNAERSEELTDSENIYLLTAPLSILKSRSIEDGVSEVNSRLPDDLAVLVTDFSESDDVERSEWGKLLSSRVGTTALLNPGEFVHADLVELQEHRSAWMGIYDFSVKPIGRSEIRNTESETESPEMIFETAWARIRGKRGLPDEPDDHFEGAFLMTGAMLRKRPDIMQGLWKISQDGFGKILGAYHPISMEVTREFFEDHMLQDDIYTSVRFVDGKPICFGNVALHLNHNHWLDTESTVFSDRLNVARDGGRTPAHFFEMISSAKGVSYAPDIISLFAEVAEEAGKSYHVFFESTNLSSLYIPKIITRQVEQFDGIEFVDEIQRRAKLNYWFLKTATSNNQ